MKKMNFVLFVAILMLMPSGALAYTLNIKLVNQDPFPAERGQAVDLLFKADVKEGSNPPQRLLFGISPEYPFSAISNTTIDMGNPANIPLGQPFTFKFRVLVDKNAERGNNTIKVGYGFSDSGVAFQNYNLDVQETRTDFDVVMQDISENSVSVGIVNSGKNAASSVVVKIPQQDDFSVTGTNANIIGDLNKGDFTLATFKLVPKSRDEAPLKIEIDYTDSIGNRYAVEKEVPLKIDATTFISRNRTAGQRGQQGIFSSPFFGAGAALVLVGIVYGIYKFRQRKKHEI